MAPPFLCALALTVWHRWSDYHGTGVTTGREAGRSPGRAISLNRPQVGSPRSIRDGPAGHESLEHRTSTGRRTGPASRMISVLGIPEVETARATTAITGRRRAQAAVTPVRGGLTLLTAAGT